MLAFRLLNLWNYSGSKQLSWQSQILSQSSSWDHLGCMDQRCVPDPKKRSLTALAAWQHVPMPNLSAKDQGYKCAWLQMPPQAGKVLLKYLRSWELRQSSQTQPNHPFKRTEKLRHCLLSNSRKIVVRNLRMCNDSEVGDSAHEQVNIKFMHKMVVVMVGKCQSRKVLLPAL